MRVRLLNDWVLVEVDEMAKTIGSIIIPDKYSARDAHTATVVQVGPGKTMGNGVTVPLEVVPGDRVVFHRWNVELKNGAALCHALEEMGERFALIKEADILLVWPAGEEHTFW